LEEAVLVYSLKKKAIPDPSSPTKSKIDKGPFLDREIGDMSAMRSEVARFWRLPGKKSLCRDI
jgi:hypothetical protein